MVTVIKDCLSLYSESYHLINKSCNIILTLNNLYLNEKSTKNEKNTMISISLNDIIGCQICKLEKLSKEFSNSAFFKVFTYPLISVTKITGNEMIRTRKVLNLGVNKFNDKEQNIKVAENWVRAILWCIKDRKSTKKDSFISIPSKLPKRLKLLILINPASGPGKALKIFNKEVVPLFIESDVAYESIITNTRFLALNVIKNEKDIRSKWDGVVSISGDGLLFEIFNGLMQRTDWEDAIKIPVGTIPGGSGNGLAHSINHSLGNIKSISPILSSTINIIQSCDIKMDLVKVELLEKTLYSFLSICWGFLADVDIESEILRKIGESRFTLWSILRIIAFNKYQGRLSYLPIEENESNQKDNQDLNNSSNKKNFKSSNKIPYIPKLNEPITKDWKVIDGSFALIVSSIQPAISSSCLIAPESKFDDGIIWLTYIKSDVSRVQMIQFLLSLKDGNHVKLPFVKIIPVQAFRIEPLNGKLTVDGELITLGPIQASILPSFARVMHK